MYNNDEDRFIAYNRFILNKLQENFLLSSRFMFYYYVTTVVIFYLGSLFNA